jgi:hypothetical protein
MDRRSCYPIVAMLLLAGCGSDRIPISGDVTFDGEPVLTGTIAFEPVDGKGAATGGKITDGKYSLVGDAAPQPGTKKVRIAATRKTGRRIQAQFAPPGTLTDEIERYIPDIYNTRTTLTCEVSRDGSHQIDFNLRKP